MGAHQQVQICEGERGVASFENQCLHSSLDGKWYLNDGPSVPHVLVTVDNDMLRWNESFWEAAVDYHYCYHHGAATYGYSRDTCDEQMLEALVAICEADFTGGDQNTKADPTFNRENYGKQAHRAFWRLLMAARTTLTL